MESVNQATGNHRHHKTATSGKRSKRNNKHKRTIPKIENNCPLLCFDSETTNHGELLELSVFDATGHESYHSYFRPHAKSWPSEIHHITPEMVSGAKRFIAHKGEISHLLNGAKFLLGCAISNDIHNLKRHGVTISDDHLLIDIQSWYWLLRDNTDRREKYQTGLAAIGESFGLDFGDERAHSATADTRLTLECFKALVREFNTLFPDGDPDSFDLSDKKYLHRLVSRFNEQYKQALQVYKMRNACGYVSVMKRELGFSLKFHRFRPDDDSKFLVTSYVEDREQAEHDLRIYLKQRELKGFTGIYDLQESDFEYLRNYTNEINEEKYLKRRNQNIQQGKNTRKVARKALSAKKTYVKHSRNQKSKKS